VIFSGHCRRTLLWYLYIDHVHFQILTYPFIIIFLLIRYVTCVVETLSLNDPKLIIRIDNVIWYFKLEGLRRKWSVLSRYLVGTEINSGNLKESK